MTVKIRKGWDQNPSTRGGGGKICESAGGGRHHRSRQDPGADVRSLRRLGKHPFGKGSGFVPVIGNGDVFTAEDAAAMLELTGCDMVMVGRGALGNPWIFQQINAWLRSETQLPTPGPAEKMYAMLRTFSFYANIGRGPRHAGGQKARRLVPEGASGRGSLPPGGRGPLETLADLQSLCQRVLAENR